jgi:hypothetical protein
MLPSGMFARPAIGALLATALAFGSGAARADGRDDSRAAFVRGVTEAHLGHYTAARDDFLEAYKLFAHPSILLNLGIARLHTGEYVAAEQDLMRFLSDDGGASSDEIASGRAALADVRQHLGTIHMRIAPLGARATLDGAPVALVPAAFAEVRAVIGPNRLRVEADGFAPTTQTIFVRHEQPAEVDLVLAPLGGTKEPPPTPEVRRVAPPPEAPPVAQPAEPRDVLGWSLLGVGAVTAGIGVFCGLRAISLASAYNSPSSTYYQNHSTRTMGITFRTTADVLFVTAIASGGMGVYLLATTPKRGPSAKAVVGPVFSGVVGTF